MTPQSMNVDGRGFWARYRLLGGIAFVGVVLSILGASLVSQGLGATREARQLQDSGVAATVNEVRVHVVHNRRKSTPSNRYSVDQVEVTFKDPQGLRRSESLGSWWVDGKTPRSAGWTTQFDGEDHYLGREVLYLTNRPGQAQMRDQVASTLAHGYDPVNTYVGTGMSVLAVLAWVAFAKVWIAQRRGRRRSGIA